MASDPVIEKNVPSGVLCSIKFDLMTGGDIEKFSSANIAQTSDVTSAKLGLPNASSQCTTCGSTNIRDCDGHFGAIKLPTTIYHPHLVSEVVRLLNRICPGCKSIKKERRMKRKLVFGIRRYDNKDKDYIPILLGYGLRKNLLKFVKLKLSDKTRSVLARMAKVQASYCKSVRLQKKWGTVDNQTGCKYCCKSKIDWYPQVKFKVSSKDMQGKKGISIIAEFSEKLPKKFQNRSLSELLPPDYWNFIPKVSKQQGADINRINLSPSQGFYLLRQLDPEFIKQFVSRRELLFLSYLPVTPNCQRVTERSHAFTDGPQLSFDECTKAYRRVVDLSRKIDEFHQHEQFGALVTSYVTSRVVDCFHLSKLHSNRLLDGDDPSARSGLKWVKDVVLSKRTDNAFRMTMVGDPKIKLGEIGVPHDIAQSLYIAEHVNAFNKEKLNLRCNMHLLTKDELYARSRGNLISVRKSNQLQVGDVFYRPLENGDLVLVNRPPSVHQHSLIALAVKILPSQSVISVNPLCCAPLLGDFDGDCLHGYVPQSIRCRVELGELVSLEHQLLNAQDGRSLLSLTHDSLTAAHLLTRGGEFLNKFEMQQFEMLCSHQSPCPAILEAATLQNPLWTGQQLFSMLLPPSMDFAVVPNEIKISEGEILFSSGISFWLQNNTSGIFTRMFRCYGKKALDYLFSAQEVLCEYLSWRGLSVSLGDVYLTTDSYTRQKMIDEVHYGLEEAENSCKINELMLNPEMEFFLKADDENEDLSHCLRLPNFGSGKTQIKPASIAAFKEVFRELQSVVHHHICKDNSLLAMIHAGSKGSLLKLVQQGVCLGLQLPPNTLPFKMPRELSCARWNQQKALNWCDTLEDAVDCATGQNSYAVIGTSFLDGLNPLECFFHALCGRANFFSENADVPGTLTRKLMFFMRDLYIAYDGTVRSVYGQQLVQFSYDLPDESSSIDSDHCEPVGGEKDSASNGLGGQPVGSWAACSISEAAYGALDHPVNSLEDSPLINLKKVLECAPARTSLDRTASLILSNKLKRLNYGFEYGALEVKNHLERVFFADVVTSVMIFYAAQDVEGTEHSPWVTHFHVNKERMMIKRLKIQSIIEELTGNYNSVREKLDTMLPSLYISSKNCFSDAKMKEFDETCCISVAVENSDSPLLLDTIRDSVIPILLHTLIKGFLEFKKVDILCGSFRECYGELFLKIAMSEDCLPGKFWCTLQNACLPIMDLIDWQRSHPDGVNDISSAFGIDCAWKYFLQSLKSASSDIGRTVNQEHLLVVADCLSVTGEFHGLGTKGLKQQRNIASISSPFVQACFSNPDKTFVDAAKQGSIDHLYGTIDSLAWGKEAPIGTGGPFEMIYSDKVHNTKETGSIYETLLSPEPKSLREHVVVSMPPNQDNDDKWKGQPFTANADKWKGQPFTANADKWKGQPFTANADASRSILDGYGCHNSKDHTILGSNSASVSCNVGSWADIADMVSSLRAILHQYPINGHLNEADKCTLTEALTYHPKRDAKIGIGVQAIKIGHSPLHRASRCFVLIRKDGTTEDFSYRKCVIGAAKQISPEFGSMVEKKLYHRR